MTSSQPQDRRQHVGVVLGVVAGVLVLALLGFVVVRLASGRTGRTAVTASPGASTQPSPVLSPLAPLPLVDYTGQDFIAVRSQLRDLQLGVRLIFGTGGDSQAVDHTTPPPGTPVDRGITIKVYVTGKPPLLDPPGVVGRPCSQAGRDLATAGLYPQYPTGRAGLVTAQDPPGGAAGVHWNDQVRIWCGPPGSGPPGSGPGSGQPGVPGESPSGPPAA